jgi:hypothetical protein
MYEEAYYVNAQYAHWQEARLEKPARSRGSPLPP